MKPSCRGARRPLESDVGSDRHRSKRYVQRCAPGASAPAPADRPLSAYATCAPEMAHYPLHALAATREAGPGGSAGDVCGPIVASSRNTGQGGSRTSRASPVTRRHRPGSRRSISLHLAAYATRVCRCDLQAMAARYGGFKPSWITEALAEGVTGLLAAASAVSLAKQLAGFATMPPWRAFARPRAPRPKGFSASTRCSNRMEAVFRLGKYRDRHCSYGGKSGLSPVVRRLRPPRRLIGFGLLGGMRSVRPQSGLARASLPPDARAWMAQSGNPLDRKRGFEIVGHREHAVSGATERRSDSLYAHHSESAFAPKSLIRSPRTAARSPGE